MGKKDCCIEEELYKGLIGWYNFQPERRALLIAGGKSIHSYETVLLEKNLKVDLMEIDPPQNEAPDMTNEKYDYILLIEVLEYFRKPKVLLRTAVNQLSSQGILLIGVNNRLGLRYICGDRDKYTERSFDGVENYWSFYAKPEDAFKGRMYDRVEITNMLEKVGVTNSLFFSVFPTLEAPTHIFRDGYRPNEKLFDRVFPEYYYPNSVFLEQDRLYEGFEESGLLHVMANAFLVEGSVNDEVTHSDILSVTASLDRGKENAVYTIIRGESEESQCEPETVEKKPVYPEGNAHIEKLYENSGKLAKRGLRIVEEQFQGKTCRMPYIKAVSGQQYLEQLAFDGNIDAFWRELDHFKDCVMESSDICEGSYVPPLVSDARSEREAIDIQKKYTVNGQLFKQAYLDMVPLNSFHDDSGFIFYDQEFCIENYPVKAVLNRMIATLYAWNTRLEGIIPSRLAYERYGLWEERDLWHRMEWEFLDRLKNNKALENYHQHVRTDMATLNFNRQHVNYSSEEYQTLFVDIFKNADTRKLILFGSGVYAARFMDTYAMDYPVYAIIDNNKDRWGQKLGEIEIQSADLLRTMSSGEYKVIICIKNYLSVMKQLEELGIKSYGVFNPWNSYPRKVLSGIGKSTIKKESTEGKKKFHIGYISGVFDLFHKGHLNLLKRAKEQCDYLIVGVVSDEGVRKYKETEPFIPFDERIEIVMSCRYVDQAVRIPLESRGIEDAYRMLNFDCQFCGSDYLKDPAFEKGKKFLEEHGSELVILPYTKSTSSTKLKSLIERRMI